MISVAEAQAQGYAVRDRADAPDAPLTGQTETPTAQAHRLAGDVVEFVINNLDFCHPPLADAAERRAYLREISDSAVHPEFGSEVARLLHRHLS